MLVEQILEELGVGGGYEGAGEQVAGSLAAFGEDGDDENQQLDLGMEFDGAGEVADEGLGSFDGGDVFGYDDESHNHFAGRGAQQ